MEKTMIKTLCVYCGSNFGNMEAYRAGAEALGAAMAERDIALVYGAGNVGLMGAIADAVLSRGGRAVGVIPRKLAELGLAHGGLQETVIADTMRERKAIMIERSDAFVAMPGGIGTLEELAELMTLNQLGYESKPLGLLDAGGFWRPFMAFMEHVVDQGFLKRAQLDQVAVDADPERLLDRLASARPAYVPKWI
jgi:hypothetical protein